MYGTLVRYCLDLGGWIAVYIRELGRAHRATWWYQVRGQMNLI